MKCKKKTSFRHLSCSLLLVLFLLCFHDKKANAYYAKAFNTGFIQVFNLFYTSNINRINGLYSINDVEVGFSKYLWAEFEFSFMYGKNHATKAESFGLNYWNARFFAPVYQGEKLNISMGIGGFTPGLYIQTQVGKDMVVSNDMRPTFGINIDYNTTKEQRIDWQLFYRKHKEFDMLYSGLSYKINIKPIYTWIYYDNFINLRYSKQSFAQFIIVATHPFGKDDRYLIGGSVNYTMGYSDKKFDYRKISLGFVFCVDFNNLW